MLPRQWRIWNPFSFLFSRPKSDDRLAAYLIREHARGRSLDDILEDPYIRNRSNEAQRGRLIERPDVIHAVGRDTHDAA